MSDDPLRDLRDVLGEHHSLVLALMPDHDEVSDVTASDTAAVIVGQNPEHVIIVECHASAGRDVSVTIRGQRHGEPVTLSVLELGDRWMLSLPAG